MSSSYAIHATRGWQYRRPVEQRFCAFYASNLEQRVASSHPTGFIGHQSARTLATWANWGGEPAAFVRYLVSSGRIVETQKGITVTKVRRAHRAMKERCRMSAAKTRPEALRHNHRRPVPCGSQRPKQAWHGTCYRENLYIDLRIRALYRRPRWVSIDEAMEICGRAWTGAVKTVLRARLRGAAGPDPGIHSKALIRALRRAQGNPRWAYGIFCLETAIYEWQHPGEPAPRRVSARFYSEPVKRRERSHRRRRRGVYVGSTKAAVSPPYHKPFKRDESPPEEPETYGDAALKARAFLASLCGEKWDHTASEPPPPPPPSEDSGLEEFLSAFS